MSLSLRGSRIVMSGGTGLIGGVLVDRLVELDAEVIVLSRQEHPDLPGAARAVQWDAVSPGPWGEALEGSMAVVHLAGENLASARWTEARKRRLVESRVHTGALLADAIRRSERPPSVYLQASAVGYYGDRGLDYIEERARPGDDFLARLCVEWEAAARDLQERLRSIVMRFGIVLSRRGGALPRMALPFRCFVGGPIGRGDQGVSWIHLTDVVEAMLYLLRAERARGTYNVTAPEPVSNREFSRTLGRTLRRPWLFRVPGWVLRLFYGEMADALLKGQYVMPQRLLDQGFSFRFPTLQSALADLYR